MPHFLLTPLPPKLYLPITPKQLLSRQPRATAASSSGKCLGLIILRLLSPVYWSLPLQAALSFIARQGTILTGFSHLTGRSFPDVLAGSSLPPQPPGVDLGLTPKASSVSGFAFLVITFYWHVC